ncbi:MAG: enoyl-CoA hydratase/isomerase family protein [Acidimicrobiales bacterium]
MTAGTDDEAGADTGVEIEYRDGVCWITLARPERLNAVDTDMLRTIRAEQLRLMDDAEQARAVVFSGSGRAFCAGADLAHIEAIARDPLAYRGFLHALRDVIVGFEQLPQPVIAAVHGVALAGGFELMSGCDIIVAARSAMIGDQHAQRGFVPGGGSSQRVPRWLPRPQARDLLFSGRWLTGDDALAMGLVSRVTDDDDLLAVVGDLARELAGRNWPAMRRMKELARLAEELPLADGLEVEIRYCLEHGREGEVFHGVEGFRRGERSSPDGVADRPRR